MAILLVKIEDLASLALNEFYDFNGRVYALSCSRVGNRDTVIELLDFYEATARTTMLEEVPVVFVAGSGERAHVVGWYRSAKVYKEVQTPALFLEGNIEASALDAVLLPENARTKAVKVQQDGRCYEVVELEDARYDELMSCMMDYKGENAFLRYGNLQIQLESSARRDFNACMGYCEMLAQRVVGDQCKDIAEIKSLELYAKRACELKPADADGYYYLALAEYQLGFEKRGLKSIGKALKLEPEAADLQALKGMLLVSRGYHVEGAKCLREAYQMSHEEEYLLTEGRVWMIAGQMDQAYACFEEIEDKDLLDNAGIQMSHMEKKWPFLSVRGLKDWLFSRK